MFANRLRNSVLADTILNYVREYFSKTGFLYNNPSQVKILAGQDEGTTAWISTNYFLRKFKPVKEPKINFM